MHYAVEFSRVDAARCGHSQSDRRQYGHSETQRKDASLRGGVGQAFDRGSSA